MGGGVLVRGLATLRIRTPPSESHTYTFNSSPFEFLFILLAL